MPSALMELPPAISEPVQLTSATLRGINVGASTSRTTLQASPASSSRSYGPSGVAAMGTVVRVSQSGTSLKRSKAHAVFASQGEGIVIIDPATQRALHSYTLPSSHQPITPPIVIFNSTHQTTFICAWPRTQGNTAELHSWTEAIGKRSAASIDAQASHHVAEVDISIASLHPFSATQLLAQARDGSLSTIDFGSLQEPRPRQVREDTIATGASQRVVHTTVLDRLASASVLRSYPTRPSGALAITMTCEAAGQQQAESKTRSGRKGRKSAMEVIDAAEGTEQTAITLSAVRLNVTAIESDGSMRHVGGAHDLPTLFGTDGQSEVLTASLHHSGRLAILLASGELISAYLAISPDGAPTVSDVSRVMLALPAKPEQHTRHAADLAIVTPATVFVTISSATSTHHACALLIDVELGAVLAETEWRVSSGGIGNLHAHRIGGSTMLILASPNAEQSGSRVEALHLYALPYEAGEGNHLRWALASRHLTAKWVSSPKTAASQNGTASSQAINNALLRDLTHMSEEGNAEAMDAAFAQWLASQPRRTVKNGRQFSKSVRISQKMAQALAVVSLPPPKSMAQQDSSSTKRRPYARQVVHALLQHHAVSSAFVPERRLLEALKDTEDGAAVMLALRDVDDLAESDIVTVLVRSQQAQEGTTKTAENDFDTLLSVIADLQVSRTPFRQAMKSLVDDKSLTAMLEALNTWLDQTASTSILKEESQGKTSSEKSSGAAGVPTLQGCLALAIDVLDTFFPTLLNDASLHAHLSRLATQVQAHLVALNRLQILRAPLAAFARLEDDMKREAEAAAAAKEQRRLNEADASEDERDMLLSNLRVAAKDRASGGEQATSHIGGGSMFKYGLPEKSHRLKLEEESMSVGLYQLEQLEL